MSFAGVTSFIVAMNDIVSCSTCTRPAFVEDRFYLDSTDGLVEHLRTSCIGGHSAVQLADRVTHVSLPTPTSRHGQRPWPTGCTPEVLAPRS